MVLERSPKRVIGHMIDDVDERLVVNTIATTLSIQEEEEEEGRTRRKSRERERVQATVECTLNR